MSIARYVAEGHLDQENARSPQIDTIHIEYGGDLRSKFSSTKHYRKYKI